MAVLKVLVFGNVDDSLEQAITKGNALTKSKNGPFDLLILLATRRVLEGTGAETLTKLRLGQIPVELAINLVIVDETAEEEMAFDHDKMRILYSGARQVRTLTTLGGLTLGWVGHGAPGRIEGRKLVDILVSGSIPAHANPASPPDQGHRALAGVLAGRVLPKYHFAMGQEFFERAPYKSPLIRANPSDNNAAAADDDDESKMRLTRFITLGTFGGKARWFYAFNLDLDTTKPVEIPAGTTVNPYEAYRQQVRQDQSSNNRDGGDGSSYKRGRGDGLPPRPAKRQARVVSPSECFLCLSNPTLESHLITSIADNSYLALAKGPLLEAAAATTTQPGKIPGHLIVVPISHLPALPADPAVRGPLEAERTRYITALHQLFNAQAPALDQQQKEPGVVTVAFDLSRATGVHYHTQVMAVPAGQADALETVFEKYQQLNEIDASSVTRELAPKATNFFRFQITRTTNTTSSTSTTSTDSTTTTTTFVIPLSDDPRRRFDLQFGRRVVAEVLTLAHRMDWRACEQTKPEEEQAAVVFKAAFTDFDPTTHPELYPSATAE
ncbi:hypothetical protein D0Z00_000369 [Geotrichum galactomycetum]|uniref:Uncharacterized protein n=1 Tax=Geotrichum galactomycetum TaxID=27317 RepID=A0ACB6VA17_9ASCO|nr:hypothetical protein D0Z00_000369 [Geotrichum candidum]